MATLMWRTDNHRVSRITRVDSFDLFQGFDFDFDIDINPKMSLAAMPPPSRQSDSSENYYPVSRTNTISSRDGSRSLLQSKRQSAHALYLSMSARDRDMEIEDDLARAQKSLRDLKAKISTQSKRNFVLEKDVRYLDSRIALLIQNRLRIEEVSRLPAKPTIFR